MGINTQKDHICPKYFVQPKYEDNSICIQETHTLDYEN